MPAELAPQSTAELAEALRQCARAEQSVAVIGAGTKLSLGNEPASLDAVIRTAKMARILDYAPSDMVLSAEAGVTLATVQAAARENRQMLALDPPWADRATVGGVVAANDFGPRRARYGAVRDLIIGITVVRADGAVARSGGKVVKNVAGFDLPKVMCGSLGTLAAIGSVYFRLHPLPEASATASVAGLAPAQVPELLVKLRDAQLEPTAAVALRSADGRYELGLRFEGFGKGVEQQLARLSQLAPAQRLDDAGATAFWTRHDAIRSEGAVRVKMASLPSRLASIDPMIASIGGQFAWYGTLGIGFLAAMKADPAALQAARASLTANGGSLVLQAAPPELKKAVDPWGPPPPSFKLMKSLKDRFDPQRRLNPGRFVGGL